MEKVGYSWESVPQLESESVRGAGDDEERGEGIRSKFS